MQVYSRSDEWQMMTQAVTVRPENQVNYDAHSGIQAEIQ